MSYLAVFTFTEPNNSYIGKLLEQGKFPNFYVTDIGQGLYRIEVFASLHEDFTYEVKSNFESYGEKIGGVSSFAGNLLEILARGKSASSLGGTVADSVVNDRTKFLVWKETEPFKMSVKCVFETKTDPYYDVHLPTILLVSRTILSPVSKSLFRVPGFYPGATVKRENTRSINQSNTSETEFKAATSDESKNNSKLLSNFSIAFRKIDKDITSYDWSDKTDTALGSKDYSALISLADSFIESAKPTFSHHRTTSGVPIKSEVEVQVQSLFSAEDRMFSNAVGTTSLINTSDLGVAATNIFR